MPEQTFIKELNMYLENVGNSKEAYVLDIHHGFSTILALANIQGRSLWKNKKT